MVFPFSCRWNWASYGCVCWWRGCCCCCCRLTKCHFPDAITIRSGDFLLLLLRCILYSFPCRVRFSYVIWRFSFTFLADNIQILSIFFVCPKMFLRIFVCLYFGMVLVRSFAFPFIGHAVQFWPSCCQAFRDFFSFVVHLMLFIHQRKMASVWESTTHRKLILNMVQIGW